MSTAAGPERTGRPEVSVLLATYGRPQLLGRALRSLAEQTLDASRFEVLVIVNGPPGDTPEVVAAAREEHPGTDLRVLVSEKPGVAHARTLGLWAARGDHFTILDDDDWFSPTFLEELLEHVSPGVVPLAWMADIYDEKPDEPSFENYFSTALERQRGRTVPALDLPQAISLNVCKLMPVDAARAVPYDESLHGGSDFVFWTKMFARDQFRFRVIQGQDAVYYRTRGHGSLSRRDPDFDFAVNWRLACIASLDELPPQTPDVERMVRHMVAAQCGHINRYLAAHPDERDEVVAAIERRDLGRMDWRAVNRGLARDLVLTYGFAPWNGTSGLVAARRVHQLGNVVDVVAKDRDDAQPRDPSSSLIADPLIDRFHAVPGRSRAPGWPQVLQYAAGVQRVVDRWQAEGKVYDSVYSRAQWVAAHLVAARFKIRNPETRWVAEFSDPLNRNIMGDPPRALVYRGPLLKELRGGIHDAGFVSPSGLSMCEWAEHLVYALADEIIFTNENQRTYMLGYCPEPALAERALSVSRVERHPTPRAEMYAVNPTPYDLDPDRVHVAYFGVFYATRGLTEVVEALSRLRAEDRARVRLHVFTAKPDDVRADVHRAGLGDVVVVNPYVPYTAFLHLTTKFDLLLVNDAAAAAHHDGINPYLPSKLSDYLGSGTPIWSIVEAGSPLSNIPVSRTTALGDADGAAEVLRGLVAERWPDRLPAGSASTT